MAQTSELTAARTTNPTGSGIAVRVHSTSRDCGSHVMDSPVTSTATV